MRDQAADAPDIVILEMPSRLLFSCTPLATRRLAASANPPSKTGSLLHRIKRRSVTWQPSLGIPNQGRKRLQATVDSDLERRLRHAREPRGFPHRQPRCCSGRSVGAGGRAVGRSWPRCLLAAGGQAFADEAMSKDTVSKD